MQRSLSTYPLEPEIRAKLIANGFDIVDDLKNFRPLSLSKEIDVTHEEALELLKMVFPNVYNFDCSTSTSSIQSTSTVSLLDILKVERFNQPIITFSEKLDDMLGGGIPISKITEICGAPGVGKTQMCLQLSVDVQIPGAFGGINGEAVFIDTEGSFTAERTLDIANAAVQHCHLVASEDKTPASEGIAKNFTVSSILSKIHFYRCHNYTQLIAIVNLLPDFLAQHPQVRLIIIDSIAFPFRTDFDGKLNIRTRILNGLSQKLMQVAITNKLSVVLTNQMTTRVEGEGQSQLIPALGESWGHACTIRLILFWKGSKRNATLFKSPWKQEATTEFQITTAGIRDTTDDRINPKVPSHFPPNQSNTKRQNATDTNSTTNPCNKRRKSETRH